MKNRDFEKVSLDNGLRIYAYPDNTLDYSGVKILIPYGNCHNEGKIPEGFFHFLEHMTTYRSYRYPRFNEFTNLIEKNGGTTYASISSGHTNFSIEVLPQHFKQATDDLFNQTFYPQFIEEDIAFERRVIGIERDRAQWYHPARNMQELHQDRYWMQHLLSDKRLIFGTDEDLELINIDMLKKHHSQYFASNTIIIASGCIDVDYISHIANRIPTHRDPSDYRYRRPGWKNKLYESRSSVECHDYTIGSITTDFPSIQEYSSIDFLCAYIATSMTQWLRYELGLIYSCTAYAKRGLFEKYVLWNMETQIKSRDDLQYVREAIHEKIYETLIDTDRMSSAILCSLNNPRRFESLRDIVNDTTNHLIYHNRGLKEKDYVTALNQCLDRQYIRSMYEKYFSKEVTGEMILSPEPAAT